MGKERTIRSSSFSVWRHIADAARVISVIASAGALDNTVALVYTMGRIFHAYPGVDVRRKTGCVFYLRKD